jgi:hypothetical protein
MIIVGVLLSPRRRRQVAGRRSRPQIEEPAPIAAPVELCEDAPAGCLACDPINLEIADRRCAQIGPGR